MRAVAGGRRKASFSVEAAWVFGISMLIIYAVIVFSFTLYQETYDYIIGTKADGIDAVKLFRLAQMGEDVLSMAQKGIH